MTLRPLNTTASNGVATTTLDRPGKRNALDEATLQALNETCHRLANDDTIHSVLLRGAGPAFCAGVDLADLSALLGGERPDDPHGARAASDMADLGAAACRAIESLPQPTVAAIQGYAIGAGVVIAAACDIRVMASNAFIWIPELELGTPLLWAVSRVWSVRLDCRPQRIW